MKSWLPNSEIETTETTVGSVALAPDVLALKIKIMQRPTFYEVGSPATHGTFNTYHIQGMKFADIIRLADALGNSNSSATHVKLQSFQRSCALYSFVSLGDPAILRALTYIHSSHMMKNPDQSRDRQYITEAFDYVQKMVKSTKQGSEDINAKWNFASATLCEVLLFSIQR